MDTDLMFSSKRADWETPPELFQRYDDQYHFTLDVCANDDNTKVRMYFDETKDGLTRDWLGRCWCNPPYGRQETEKWVRKAHEEVFVTGNAELVVLLLPARTDTKWFHKYIYNTKDFNASRGTQYVFLKGRVKFLVDGKVSDAAPFPSMVVLMRKPVEGVFQ